MTDEDIDQYYQTYLEKMNSLEVFTAARLAFSRMVESLLLLDKLCFLLEQVGTSKYFNSLHCKIGIWIRVFKDVTLQI